MEIQTNQPTRFWYRILSNYDHKDELNMYRKNMYKEEGKIYTLDSYGQNPNS